jgi:hypothetical protein
MAHIGNSDYPALEVLLCVLAFAGLPYVLLNHIEVAIRCFDPCLSCATHALGQMPLEVSLVGADGTTIDRLTRNMHGVCTQD